ncbi:phage major tail protein, TP901-1 family [Pediococcus pentosaceus]|uniref:phage major tail protein, TP901-1 family n=1 Tax=Pediococcus pentosaceus TaxID=1255 RepID=UPI001E5F6C46|nr:phage major tail protein, TP901-1 family [Pediococcus pentosaceus]MCG7196517.1 phage major tail protein, TP901-1 family [Pediococcus pentosaceus]MCI2396189.1 phage major tail protein, TP901-1 family [Pediococcus pentosaceus]MCV3318990.1 phage major tail protein, TP901-1 family [Pediococcus pentosaceus]
MANETEVVQGDSIKMYYRRLSWAKERVAELVPYQTSAKLTFKRDSDSTKTKDGNVATSASLEPELELEFINNSSVPADEFYRSIIKNEKIEIWLVDIDRTNSVGENFAWYTQATVSEDETEAKTGDASERSITFSVVGTPKQGWLTLSEEQHAQIDYIFRGLSKVISGEDGNEENGGTAWKDGDEGTYVPKAAAPTDDGTNVTVE